MYIGIDILPRLFFVMLFHSYQLTPNKAGVFFMEGGVSLILPPSYFNWNISNINITLHNC